MCTPNPNPSNTHDKKMLISGFSIKNTNRNMYIIHCKIPPHGDVIAIIVFENFY